MNIEIVVQFACMKECRREFGLLLHLERSLGSNYFSKLRSERVSKEMQK